MIKLMILLFTGFVLDYPLQGEFLSKYKSQNNLILLIHCSIWSFGLGIVLLYLGLFEWWKVGMLFIGHFLCDYWKCRGLYKKWPMKTIVGEWNQKSKVPVISDWGSYYIDQTFHIIQIALCLINNVS